MSTPATPSAPTPSGDDRKPVAIDETALAPSFEDRVQMMWEKNRKAIVASVVVILLVILGKGAWEYLADQRERGIEQAFAAATTPAQVKAFIAANPSHSLAAVGHLRLADEAYAEGRFSDAVAPYEQAIAVLKTGPLASRARLGLAMAKLQGGRTADGEAALKAFVADEGEPKAYRVEAAYHLTSLAAAAGNAADVKTYAEQLMQLDPATPWTQRAIQLRATVAGAEPSAEATPASDAPMIKLPGK